MERCAINIGNSTIRIAEFEDQTLLQTVVFPATCATEDLAEELLRLNTGSRTSVVLSSVVPQRTREIAEYVMTVAKVPLHIVRPEEVDWMEIRYHPRHSLGSDRVCAILAAKELYGSPVLVVDCGTATTVNLVDNQGNFLGGMITPGMGLAFGVLHAGTAQLPRVLPGGDQAIFGQDTNGNIRSGVLRWTVYGIIGALTDASELLGQPVSLVLTGGHADHIRGAFFGPTKMWSGAEVFHDPDLVLRGANIYGSVLDRRGGSNNVE